MFACSYAVTVLHGYDKVVAAIKGVGVAAIKEVDAATGRGEVWGKIQPFKKAVSEQHHGKLASLFIGCIQINFQNLTIRWLGAPGQPG